MYPLSSPLSLRIFFPSNNKAQHFITGLAALSPTIGLDLRMVKTSDVHKLSLVLVKLNDWYFIVVFLDETTYREPKFEMTKFKIVFLF